MEIANVNGVSLEFEAEGSGEPLLMIHGAAIAETFRPLMKEPALAKYRKIRVHRRGYAGSSRVSGSLSFPEHVADAVALLRHLGVSKTHVAGHSYGGLTSMRLALTEPSIVQSLVLIEPPLLARPTCQASFASVRDAVIAAYARGDKAGALQAFALGVGGARGLERSIATLGPGALAQGLADADTLFACEFPSLARGLYSDAEAPGLRMPALALVGGDSLPLFQEGHRVLLETLPNVEGAVIPDSEHFLLVEKPREIAQVMAKFLAKHAIG